MAEKKKLKGERDEKKRTHLMSKTKTLKRKIHKKKDDSSKRKGPHLPNQLRREIDFLNPNPSKSEDAASSDDGDIYEYDEPVPQEESKKNRRFDPVDNLEYELPEDFEDENVPSSDDDANSDVHGALDDSKLEAEEDDDDTDRHRRMLQGITGMPGEVFEGKKRKRVFSMDTIPGSKHSHNRAASNGNGRISIHDLLDPLHGKPGYSKLRKRVHELERHSTTISAPLPKADREKLERKAAYEQSKKDITKWDPLVKRNREAPTIYFDEDIDLGYSTVGAIAAEFKPRTEFEKKIASAVCDPKIMEAYKQDGARLLELNKISVEDERDRQNRLAKMRSLLFRHEMKAKHIKKIKSKTFHRLLKKDRLKAASSEMQMDPEAAKEYAMKQEFKRAEERMTLKHKNSSKWAKRILKRGSKAQDEGTRAAISEQLHQHELLTRKMNSMRDDSSSDGSGDEDEDDESTDGEDPAKLLTKAKEKTLKVTEEEDEVPKTGVPSLPFMVRAMKKQKEAAEEEARLALQEYDSSLRKLEDLNGTDSLKQVTVSGRRVFGVAKTQPQEVCTGFRADNNSKDGESDEEFEPKENVDLGSEEKISLDKNIQVDPGLLLEESDIGQRALFKTFDDIVKDPGHKTSYEVAIFASDSWRKMKNDKEADGRTKTSSTPAEPLPQQDVNGVDQNSESESEEEMVDGILSTGTMKDYELPSQAELIHSAFAGDDVEEEFEKDKLEILNEENPEPEKPVLLPGWGQWTHIQQKKGLPSWMVEEHENARKKREDAIKNRKDANLRHVFISEKIDKKAEKLQTTTLPFPFTSKDVFEQSMRMPIGPEFNPATSVGALNRPAVVKKPGVIIKPIMFKEVGPHDKSEPHHVGQTTKKKEKNGKGGNGIKRKNSEKKS